MTCRRRRSKTTAATMMEFFADTIIEVDADTIIEESLPDVVDAGDSDDGDAATQALMTQCGRRGRSKLFAPAARGS